MARGRKPKSKWADLPLEFKESIESASDEEIKAKIAEVALNEHENVAAKKADQDLAEKMAAAKMASEGYRDATKANKLKIAYAHLILESRGKV